MRQIIYILGWIWQYSSNSCYFSNWPCDKWDSIRYFGLPLKTKSMIRNDYEPLIDKIRSPFLSWTHNILSFAGRVQLIKSVITSISKKSKGSSMIMKNMMARRNNVVHASFPSTPMQFTYVYKMVMISYCMRYVLIFLRRKGIPRNVAGWLYLPRKDILGFFGIIVVIKLIAAFHIYTPTKLYIAENLKLMYDVLWLQRVLFTKATHMGSFPFRKVTLYALIASAVENLCWSVVNARVFLCVFVVLHCPT